MKNTIRYSLMLAIAAGAFAAASRLMANENPQPASNMGCCGGMTAPMADTSTNAVPDLLTNCPVSGEKLGEMGKPFAFVYKDQEVKLCCKNCKKDFDKDPEKYMKIIRAADKK